MHDMRTTLRRKFGIAATTVAAVAALPFQAGTAHASTPEEHLSSCVSAVISTARDDTSSDMGGEINAALDACVHTYLQEMGIDPSFDTVATPTPTDDNSVDTAILDTTDTSGTDGSS